MATYATVANFRAYRKQVTSAQALDPAVQEVLDRAHDLITKLLGFEFAEYGAASTHKVRGNNNPRMVLPYFQPNSITTVVRDIDGQTISTDQWEVAGQHLYYCDAQGIERNWGTYRYTVTGVWGVGPVPDSIIEMELEVAVNIWASKESNRFTNVLGVEGDGAVGYEGALTPLQRKTLATVRAKYTKDRLFK